ncbi:TlyA family rRNA (cytidine-2'-O)-methyltransferase [Isoptericola hypogeus]|uniref:TlyA family rRNA (Cytidine-2'-O)-methyltransferase n=1 Tax=Isoptericola hypogeus TaxID=300179 RepID=A0ABN2JWJ0_9MICO
MPDARTDAELVRRGLARSRRHAAELVAAGRVSVAGRTVAKPSTPVEPTAALVVTADPADPGYASRAGGKLAGALDALAADARGRALTDALAGSRCLDLGASTGGFTDVLLRRGASHVVALDVGHGQLVPRLRDDPRVTVVEGFNVRDLTTDDLVARPEVVVGDLSFISLALALGPLSTVLAPTAHALLLVKPQFEVGRERLGAGGVVRDPELHVEAVVSVVRAAAERGLRALAVVPSPVPGPSGNREYFCWFRPAREPEHGVGPVGETAAERAVRAAVAWSPSAPRDPSEDLSPASPVRAALPPVVPIGGAP